MKKPVVLCIMDGFGINPGDKGNAIEAANTPNLTKLFNENPFTTIGASAFYDCTSLKDLVLPDNITSIGERAFHNCSSLTKVTIPDSVTEIGRYAFYSCNDLRKVTIGKNVTTIGPQAFGYCGSLYKIYCRAATPPSISSDVFFHNYTWEDYIFKICVPHESVSAYKKAWSEYADQIVGYDFD